MKRLLIKILILPYYSYTEWGLYPSMSRKSAEIMQNDEEMDAFEFMMDALGYDYSFIDIYFGKNLISKEVVNDHLDVLIKMAENRQTRASYFALGYIIMTTGSKMPQGLRNQIMEASEWHHEEGIWKDKGFEKKRKICLNDFSQKVKLYSENESFFPITLKYNDDELDKLILTKSSLRKFNEKVIHINLDGWNLIDLPYDVFKFSKVKSLSLEHNLIQEIPEEIKELKLLESIYLNDNSLQEFPEPFISLTKLKKISISNNPISILPPSIAELKQLEFLYIRGTNIEKLPETMSFKKFNSFNKTIYF